MHEMKKLTSFQHKNMMVFIFLVHDNFWNRKAELVYNNLYAGTYIS